MSLVLLAGCGSSDSELRDADVINDYGGTIERNGEQINICVCHDQEAVYLYYDDEERKLLDKAELPTYELHDTDWVISWVAPSDFNGDNNGDLQGYLSHSDMSESYIVWTWEEGEGSVYQPYDSWFYDPIVVYGPEYDPVNDFSGAWYLDGDLSATTCMVIDGYGNWSYYQRAPGDAEGTEMDYGTGFTYSADESGANYADSIMYDGVSYRVFDLDEGGLIWDEDTYYQME